MNDNAIQTTAAMNTALIPHDTIEILDPAGEFLRGRERSVYSQFGEDGLIEALLERIGETNRWCFELGAGDGVTNSNTRRLREAGWSSVLIEQDESLSDKAIVNMLPHDCIATVKASPENFQRILLVEVNAFGNPDLGVIDIDGQDYHLWAAMERTRPRIVLIEYAYAGDPDYVPPLGKPGEGGRYQAGLTKIVELGRSKGYTPLVRTYCNVLFCLTELVS